MKKFIIKNWKYLTLGLLISSLFLNFQMCSKDTSAKNTNDILNATLLEANLQIDGHKVNELDLQKKIVKLNKTIGNRDEKLTLSKGEIDILKSKLKRVQIIARNFKKLIDCQAEYNKLSTDYRISLNLNDKQEVGLRLCLEQKQDQGAVINLLELKYENCQQRHGIRDRKEAAFKKAVKDLSRKLRRGKVKSFIKGSVIGIGVLYLAKIIINKV